MSSILDYICVRLNLTWLPANNLSRRISTMYVRGYLQGSENGRVVTIEWRVVCGPELVTVRSLNLSLYVRFIPWTCASKWRKDYERHITIKEIISVLPLCTFHLYVATLKQQSAYGVYISQLIGYSSACSSVFMYLDVLGGGSVVVWVYLSWLQAGFSHHARQPNWWSVLHRRLATSCCPPFRPPPTSYKGYVYGWQRQASSFKRSNRLLPKKRNDVCSLASHDPGFESHRAYVGMVGRGMQARESPAQHIRQLEALLHREWQLLSQRGGCTRY